MIDDLIAAYCEEFAECLEFSEDGFSRESVDQFVREVVRQIVGKSDVQVDSQYVAEEARAYARDLLRDSELR